MEDCQKISLSEIKKKLNKKSAIIDFFREMGYYYPNFSSFNYNFCLEVLSGKKKLLKLGQVGGYDLPYFSKSKFLTKNHIIQQFVGDKELLEYLPNSLNKATVTREFLLALLFNVKPDKYYYLYNIYKKQAANKTFTNGKIYEVEVKNDFLNNINSFITTTNEIGKIKIHQRGQLINLVTEANNFNGNLNQINIVDPPNQFQLGNNQIHGKNVLNLQIKKNNTNRISIYKGEKKNKSDASNTEKMDAESQ